MSRKRKKHRNIIIPASVHAGVSSNTSRIVGVSQSFSGPIPPPSFLAEYDRIVPGSAARIIAQAENQTTHRIEIEKIVINSNVKKSERGQIMGLILAGSALVAAFILGFLGHEVASSVIGGVDFASLASVFIYGKYESRKEREKNRESSQVTDK